MYVYCTTTMMHIHQMKFYKIYWDIIVYPFVFLSESWFWMNVVNY